MFAQVYECVECGDVWRGVTIREEIDCDRDSVEYYPECQCGRTVREKRIDGKPVWHGLTEEEMDEEQLFDYGPDYDGNELGEY